YTCTTCCLDAWSYVVLLHSSRPYLSCFFFFFNDTATTEIYTLSLHDALPISHGEVFEHAAAPRDRDQHHHPGQQCDRVEIDAADRLVLGQDAADHHQPAAQQRDDRAVDALGDDQQVAEQEDRDRDPERAQPEDERRC